MATDFLVITARSKKKQAARFHSHVAAHMQVWERELYAWQWEKTAGTAWLNSEAWVVITRIQQGQDNGPFSRPAWEAAQPVFGGLPLWTAWNIVPELGTALLFLRHLPLRKLIHCSLYMDSSSVQALCWGTETDTQRHTQAVEMGITSEKYGTCEHRCEWKGNWLSPLINFKPMSTGRGAARKGRQRTRNEQHNGSPVR